jgi:hypothetical protein
MLEPMITAPALNGGSLPKLLTDLTFVNYTITRVNPLTGKFNKIPVTKNGQFCKGKLLKHGLPFLDAIKQVELANPDKKHRQKLSNLMGKKAGVGLVMPDIPISTASDGTPLYLLALDWDNAIVEDVIKPYVLDDIATLGDIFNLYVETSVSGSGLRGFCLTRERVPNLNLGKFECYSHDRMMVVIGRGGVGSIGEIEMADLQTVLERHDKRSVWKLDLKVHDEILSCQSTLNEDLTVHLKYPPPPPLEELLAVIPSSKSDGCTRDIWRTVIWGAMSGYGATQETRDKLIEWSERAPGEFDLKDFNGIWRSYSYVK